MTIIVATATESRASAFIRQCRPHLSAARWRTDGEPGGARPDLLVLLGNDAGALPTRGSPAANPIPLLWIPDLATARFARDFTRRVQRLGFALVLSRPWRFAPGLAKVAELVAAGTVGNVQRLSLSGAWRGASPDEPSTNASTAWRLRPQLDLCRWLLAEERAVPAVRLQQDPPALLLDWGRDRRCDVALPPDAPETPLCRDSISADPEVRAHGPRARSASPEGQATVPPTTAISRDDCGIRIAVAGEAGSLSYAVGDTEAVVRMPPSARPGVETTLRRPVADGCAAAIEVGFLLSAVGRGQSLPTLTPNACAREFEIVDAVSQAWRHAAA